MPNGHDPCFHHKINHSRGNLDEVPHKWEFQSDSHPCAQPEKFQIIALSPLTCLSKFIGSMHINLSLFSFHGNIDCFSERFDKVQNVLKIIV